MECLPVELHRMIFTISCLDGGSTGCALSAVSRYFRAASADLRYQSVSLSNSQQISLFEDLVTSSQKGEQSLKRFRVRHLFVRIGAPEKSLRTHLYEEARRDMTAAERTLIVPDIYGHFASRILFANDESTPSFSRLQELTICGHVFLPQTTSFATHLTKLHLVEKGLTDWLRTAFVEHQFPELSHLRMSSCTDRRYQETFLGSSVAANIMALAYLMGILPRRELLMTKLFNTRPDANVDAIEDTPIPTEPGTEDCKHIIMVEALDSVINAVTARVRDDPEPFKHARGDLMLHFHHPYLLPYEVDPSIKEEWLERLQGLPGRWPVGEQHIKAC
ncbi:hypothetical protein DACRYDRAFT_119742 [Dacryopinax primogenitus]|uniref:Uncharacterized protein n=1 Tax=Dacryopinax primogenitus (strain DJM 731) TaxID=1858805 RepID=M5FN69_DACPD|nr:uncharacterized protein DACRYDRAFT_119742 [Dacryopinax primogenitus]EJT96925.1 hypothetical protein DACRYDRAFT_119742 [Dacryopinax primogenitus]